MHRLTGTARNGGFLFTKNRPGNYQGGKTKFVMKVKETTKTKKINTCHLTRIL